MDQKISPIPKIEEDVLNLWQQEDIFAKVVEARKDGKQFVFYDGPPFATGLPHYGHILQMAIKDAVLRYRTMQGYNVPRKIGWDTHGLPVEYELEKELGISGKKEIIDYGIEKFVEGARAIVLRYTREWETTMQRMGRWVDVTHPYVTMDNDYIESVWWAFSELYKKGLIYKDYRVSPYCPRCGTVLSNFELNQGYRDNVSDASVYVSLRVTSEGKFKDTHLVFWTTTPWTIPAVTGMSVSPKAQYVIVNQDDKRYVLAEDRYKDVFPDDPVESTFSGSELIGLRYEPPYSIESSENSDRVVAGEHVTTVDGTGVASIAPAYGEIDSLIGKQENLPMVQAIAPDGTVKTGLGLPGEGQFIKKADKEVLADLQHRGLLVKEQPIKHTYPFCWRCGTPLLYYPATSWFVKVTDLKDRIVKENEQIKWLPEHLRDGRFGRWLEGARDWAISRDRFWGAPLPVWECQKCDEFKIIASAQELDADNDGEPDVHDFHRPYIDKITFTCEKCQGEMHRVPFVFDCWFESGSMPYAQHHYPFENQDKFNPDQKVGYPADFIAEAMDQTRGWFYTLHVLGVSLFDHRAFNSVVVSGLLQAPDGKKLSKSLRNYVEPEILFNDQGVDPMRLFLFTSTTLGEDYRFSDMAVQDVKRRWLVPLLNVLQYYQLSLKETVEDQSTHLHFKPVDNWIKARVHEACAQVTAAMEGDDIRSPNDLVRACRTFGPLVEDLSTWYVRLSRGRKDPAFTTTLREILLQISQIYAPFFPFVTEHIFQVARKNQDPQSVHLCLLAQDDSWQNKDVLHEMAVVREIVSIGRELRTRSSIAIRQPLSKLEITKHEATHLSSEATAIIEQELQIEKVVFVDALSQGTTADQAGKIGLDTSITPELKNKGLANNLRRVIQDLRKQAELQPGDTAVVRVEPLEDHVAELLTSQLAYTALSKSDITNTVLAESEYSTDSGSITIKLYQA
jgi:isoleucyl-tRNA synthetase